MPFKKSPITGHFCFLGAGCDLWHRKSSVSITCGSYMAHILEEQIKNILYITDTHKKYTQLNLFEKE